MVGKCAEITLVLQRKNPKLRRVRGHEPNSPWHDMRDSLISRFGNELGEFLAKRIGRDIRRCGVESGISHFRVAERPSRLWHFVVPRFAIQALRYNQMRSDGCCASFDGNIIHYGSRRRFSFGFNYGH